MPEILQNQVASPEQAATPESAIETETLLPPSPEEIPSKSAQEAESARNKRHELSSSREVLLEYVRKCIDSGNTDMISLANTENNPDLTEVAKTVEALNTNIDWAEAWTKIDQLATNPEYSKAQEKKKAIMLAICTPVVNGHMTAEDAMNLISSIEIREENPDSASTSGYKGIFFYQPSERKVIISTEALKDRYTEVRNGQEVEIKLDFNHLVTHEMSHGFLNSANYSPRSNQEVARQVTGAETPSSNMIARAREIINNAENYIDLQPMHVQAVLSGLRNTPAEFSQMSDQQKSRFGSLEIYQNYRKIVAADEIMTDYTAFYLQSDGSFEDFAEKCLELTPVESIARKLSASMRREGVNSSDALLYTKSILRKANSELAEGPERSEFPEENPENAGMIDEEERIPIRQRYPEIFRLLDTYRDFYGDVVETVKNNKGKIEDALGSSEEEIEEPAVGNIEGGGGDKAEPSTAREITNEFLGIAHSMLSDIGIIQNVEQIQVSPTRPTTAPNPNIPTEENVIRFAEEQDQKEELREPEAVPTATEEKN